MTRLGKSLAAAARMPQPGDEFLTTQQAAQILQRSIKTLEFWRVLGRGPRFYKQGHHEPRHSA